MKDFLVYFFGEGDTVEFNNFSVAHFLPILVGLITIFLIYHFRNSIKDNKNEKIFRYILAFGLIFSEMAYYWRLVNGSGLATSRIFPALVEQNQRADGSIVIPECLRKYLGGLEILEKK